MSRRVLSFGAEWDTVVEGEGIRFGRLMFWGEWGGGEESGREGEMGEEESNAEAD